MNKSIKPEEQEYFKDSPRYVRNIFSDGWPIVDTSKGLPMAPMQNRETVKILNSYDDEIKKLKAENEKLSKFVRNVLHEAGDWDGGSLQDEALTLGLLKSVEVTESCGEACVCYQVVSDTNLPWTCYQFNFEINGDEL